MAIIFNKEFEKIGKSLVWWLPNAQLQILNSIIRPYPIFMMNNLKGFKFAANMAAHYISMLKNFLAFSPTNLISIFKTASTVGRMIFPKTVGSHAKHCAKIGFCKTISLSPNLFIASGTPNCLASSLGARTALYGAGINFMLNLSDRIKNILTDGANAALDCGNTFFCTIQTSLSCRLNRTMYIHIFIMTFFCRRSNYPKLV